MTDELKYDHPRALGPCSTLEYIRKIMMSSNTNLEAFMWIELCNQVNAISLDEKFNLEPYLALIGTF